ncbi:MAG: nitroreductase family protein [Chloroflexota bacterium]
MEFAELEKLVKSRRSIRRFQDKDVPEELLLRAIELSTWAPNAGNQQNWYFYITRNRGIIRAVADAVQESVDLLVSWPEAADYGNAATRWHDNAAFFRSAPAAIAIATTRYQSVADKILEKRGDFDAAAAEIREQRNLAVSHIQSTSAAVTVLLLALHQMGLGACWMTGPLQTKKAVEKILKIPADKDLVTFIPVGYPAETPAPRERRPVTEVSEFLS